MAKVGIDDILNEDFEEVQSFKKAEEKQQMANLGEKFKSSGRPKKSDSEKVKRRVFYYTDEEFSKIEKVADLYDLTAAQFVKMIIKKELKKEGIL